MFKHFSRQQIAPAFHRGAVEFVVDRVVVVHKACFSITRPLAGLAAAWPQASQRLSVRVNQYATTVRRASVVKPLFHHFRPMQ